MAKANTTAARVPWRHESHIRRLQSALGSFESFSSKNLGLSYSQQVWRKILNLERLTMKLLVAVVVLMARNCNGLALSPAFLTVREFQQVLNNPHTRIQTCDSSLMLIGSVFA
jgi:hypothetical protein